MGRGPWSVAEAKARFSEVLARAAAEGPQRIERNGKPAAVVVSAETWARLKPEQSLVDFLSDPSWRALTREEAEGLFARDDGPDRPDTEFD
jgi:prevent-host-death family protein